MDDLKFLIKKPGIKSKKTRKKIFGKIIIMFFIIIIAVSAIYSVNYLKKYYRSPFCVEKIEIIDAKNTDMKKLNSILEQYNKKPFSEIAFGDLAEKLKSLEWVKDVVIHKNYPSTLIVEITEFKPIAILNCNEKFYLIGDNGSLIRNFNKDYLYKKLQIFSVKSLALYNIYKENILEVYDKLKENNIRNVSEVLIGKDIDIFTYNPHRKYIISSENIAENVGKMKLIDKVKKKFAGNNLQLKEINLKFQDKILIKL